MQREQALTDTFVELADSLVTDFDVADFLAGLVGRAVELLSTTAAGVLLAGPDGTLRVAASSSEEGRVVELFELQSEEGPCLHSFRTGELVIDAPVDDDRWPHLGSVARGVGFMSVTAVPLRYRSRVIGALNLFGSDLSATPPQDLRLAQALADVATISILQHRATADSDEVVAQLNAALQSRVVIEQAKGILAEAGGLTMARAFDAMRSFSRNNNRRLAEVADAIANRSLSTTDVIGNTASTDR